MPAALDSNRPADYQTAWGKFDSEDGFHALEAHSTDVAVVFEALCGLPVISARLSRVACFSLNENDIQRLSSLVYLHDLGKLMPGFQAKARPELACEANINHSQAGGMLIQRAFCEDYSDLAPIARRIEGWGQGVEELLFAILAHHGRPVVPMSDLGSQIPPQGYNQSEATQRYIRMWQEVFPLAHRGRALPDHPGFIHLIAGLTALADWIGSDKRFFPFEALPDSDYSTHARNAAVQALRTI